MISNEMRGECGRLKLGEEVRGVKLRERNREIKRERN